MFAKARCLLLISIAIAFLPKAIVCESDDYVEEVQEKCRSTNSFTDCVKLGGLKFLGSVAEMANKFDSNGSQVISLMRIDKFENRQRSFFTSARQSNSDGEFAKFIKFVQRRINHFLETHALSIGFPYGTTVKEVDDGFTSEARKRKKLEGIIPLIIIFQLLKVKAMAALILLGIAFIKKAIIVAAVFLPSLIHTLKGCKHHHHVYPPAAAHVEELSYDHDPKGLASYYAPNSYENGWERAYKHYNLKNAHNNQQ